MREQIKSEGGASGPFKSGDAYYVVVVNDNRVEVHRAIDPEDSWSEQDAEHRPATTDDVVLLYAEQRYDKEYDPQLTDLKVAHQEASGRVGVSVFHMATDEWDHETDVEYVVDPGCDPTLIAENIAIRSDGAVVCLYPTSDESSNGFRIQSHLGGIRRPIFVTDSCYTCGTRDGNHVLIINGPRHVMVCYSCERKILDGEIKRDDKGLVRGPQAE